MTDQCNSYRPDPDITGILKVLEEYPHDHPLAEVGVFRRRQDAISVRIVDPSFHGMSWKQRDERIWHLLEETSDDITKRISVLLLMTPKEAAAAHFMTAEFDEDDPNGPVRFMKEGVSFRERLDSHEVFITIGRPLLPDLEVSKRLDAAFKFDFPPGIMTADDEPLSVDTGHLLRDNQFAPRWFDTVEQARAAAVAEARGRLALLAAA